MRDPDGVGGQRSVVGQVGLGVAGHRGTDIPALDVEDGQGVEVTQGRQGLLEDRDAGAAVTLEEGGLGLDGGHVSSNRVDGPQGEVPQACGRVGQAPGLEQVRVGVDADAQGAVVVHGVGQAGSEGASTALVGGGGTHLVSLSSTGAMGRDSDTEFRRDRRAAMCSWRLRTWKGPRSWASRAWTAAWSC